MKSSAERTKVAELVVLVDEDGWNVRTVRHVLTELGFRVLDFSSTAAALPIIATRRVDLVLTEHALGTVDGAALFAQARAAWGESRPALLAMTRAPAAISRELTRGYDGILAKPIRVSELVEEVDRALAIRAPYQARALRRQA